MFGLVGQRSCSAVSSKVIFWSESSRSSWSPGGREWTVARVELPEPQCL